MNADRLETRSNYSFIGFEFYYPSHLNVYSKNVNNFSDLPKPFYKFSRIYSHQKSENKLGIYIV